MSTVAIFPGQGSQYVGMGKALLAEFPYVSSVFEEAEDAARFAIRKMCFDGSEEQLKLTANTQPCILTCSLAYWQVINKECGFKAEFFAGHSLGEYSALVAAGHLELGRAASLVRRRGEAMQKAVPEGVGAMAAVMKMDAEELTSLCRSISTPEANVAIANYNSPQQLVVAGHRVAVEKLASKLSALKKRCVMLAVSAPFHSTLMGPAREAMKPLIEDTPQLDSDAKVYANISGSCAEPYSFDFLVDQIDSPVKWTQTIESACETDIDSFAEIGPGKVLTSLARRMLPRNQYKLVATEDLEDFIKAYS